MHAAAGGAVMMAAALGFEDRLSVVAVGQETGKTAIGAEGRGAGIAGAGAPLVAIAVAYDADAAAERKAVGEDPFEGAPGGMHLDGGL